MGQLFFWVIPVTKALGLHMLGRWENHNPLNSLITDFISNNLSHVPHIFIFILVK